MKNFASLFLAFAVTTVILSFTHEVSAQTTYTWVGASGGGDGVNMSDANNWSPGGGPPVAGDSVVFTDAAGVETTIVVDANFSLDTILFDGNVAGGITMNSSGGSKITLTAAGGTGLTVLAASANHTMNNDVDLGSSQSWDIQTGRTFTLNGILGDGGGGYSLTTIGAGKLILAGANTFSGALNVNAGVVNLQNSGAIASSSGAAVSTSSALELEGGVAIGAVPLSLTGSGPGGSGALRNVTGANSYAGAITVLGGATVGSDAGALTLTGGVSITTGSITFTGSGDSLVNTVGISGSTPGGLIKTGTGKLTITTANTYSGATTISGGGSINIQNGSALGSTANGTDISAASTLELQGGISVGAESIQLNGVGVGGNGNLRSISGANSIAGSITLAQPARINTDAGTLTLTGGITGTGNALTVGGSGDTVINHASGINTGTGGTLVKDGSGVLTVTASGGSSMTGNTTINGGTVRIANDNVLGVVPGAFTANQLVFNGGTLENTSTITTPLNRGITLTGAGTFLVNSGTTNTIIAPITGAGGLTKTGTGNLVLGATNDFAGATLVSGGSLIVSNNASLGTAAGGTTVSSGAALVIATGVTNSELLTLSGSGPDGAGALVNASGATILNGGINNAAAATYNTVGGNLTLNGAISGSGITKLGGNTLTLGGNDSFTGGLVVHGGTAAVSGANGQLTGVTSMTVNNGAALTVGANSDTTYLDRIKDGSPIFINRGSLNLNGSLVAGLNIENMGSDFVFGGGLNTITLTPAAGSQVELKTDFLTRSNGATLVVRGSNLGSNGNNTARFFLTNTPSFIVGGGGATDSKNISIATWIVGDSVAGGAGTNFVTFTSGNGFRPLNTATEYDLTSISGVSGNNNFNTTGEYFTNGSATVNALRIAGGTVNLGGTNTTLTVTGGALLAVGSSSMINGKLAFGATEGIIHNMGGAAQTLTLSSMVTGTGGLTYSAGRSDGILVLGGMNSYTGTNAFNGGQVNIANDFNLGTAPGSANTNIVLGGSILLATADFALNANRGIELVPGGGTLSVATGNTLSYGGIITGATTNTFTKAGGGTLVLTGANTFAGPTAVTGGRLQINSDGQLGTAPGTLTASSLTLSGGSTLAWAGASGALNPNRGITLTGAGQVDVVSGSTLTYGGVIAGTGGLAKLGSGTLLLTNASVNTGSVTNSGGTLTLAGEGATMNNASTFVVQSNSTVNIGSITDTVVLDRLSNSAVLNLSGGSLTLNGADNATTTTEAIGTLTSTAGFNTLTLNSAGVTRQVELTTTNALARTGSATLLVRGDSLGSTGAGTSRVLLGTSFASGSPTNFLFSGTNSGSLGLAPTAIVAGKTTNAIINFMVGDASSTGSGNTFVTYDANGLRPLNTATELESGTINNSVSGVGGNIGNTNFTTAGDTLTGNRILNALRVTANTLDIGVGNGLTNYSGAVLFTGAASITNGTLVFPTVTNATSTNGIEGIISLHGASAFTAAIGSVIGGQSGFTNNQLTVSGNNPNSSLILSGNNTFSNLVVNNVKLGYGADNNLGIAPTAATNAGAGANITLAGGATLSNSASVTIGSTRGLTLGNGGGAFETPTGTTVTYGGIIAGAGQGLAKNGAGTLALSGASTFTGTLSLNAGTIIASGNNGALGAGNFVIGSGGTFQAIDDAARSFARPVTINGNQTILVDRLTPGAGILMNLGALTAGNSLTGGQTITINLGTNVLTTGTNPGFQFNGAINLTNTSGATTFVVNTNGGTSSTILFLAGPFVGSGDIVKDGAGDLRWDSLNNPSFTGGLTINAGRLFLNGGTGLGIGISGKPITVASGAQLDLNNAVLTGEQAVTVSGAGIGGSGAIVNGGNAASSFGGAFIQTAPTTYGVTQAAGTLTNRGGIVGDFTVTKIGAGTLVLAGDNTYAAPTIVDGGTLQLVGSGTLSGTTAVTVNNSGTLSFNNGNETNAVNHLPNAVPVTLNRGEIEVNGVNAAGANFETIGAVTLGGGNNTITLDPASGMQVGLTAASVTRNSNSVLYVRGENLGTSGADASQVMITAAPSLVGGGGTAGTRNQSIIPWAAGATNFNEAGASANFYGPTFVTYGTNGVRPLNPFTEMSIAVVNNNRTDINASVSTSENLVSNQTVNALRMVGGTLDMQNARTLTVTSGSIIGAAATTVIGDRPNYSTLAFGSAEGVVQLFNAGMTINSMITGSGGLTVGSFNNQTLTLTGTNSFTGNVTINGGQVSVRADANLGNAANALILQGGTVASTQDLILGRTIAVGQGGGTFSPALNTILTLNTAISSPTTNNLTKVGLGALVIPTGVANTINGPVVVAGGSLFVGDEAQLGGAPGSPLIGGLTILSSTNAATFAVTNDMSLSANRWLNLVGTSNAIDVAATKTLTVNSPVMGAGAINKAGSGTLIFANVSSNTGAIAVNGGTFAVQGNNAALLAPGTITVQSNSTLTLGALADTTVNPNRVGDNAAIILNNGMVNLNGSANASTTAERIGTLTFGSGYNSLTLTPGGGEVDLVSSNVLTRTANSGATALVRGTELGTNLATGSRILYSTTPTNFLVSGTNGGPGSVSPAVVNGATTNAIIPWLVGDNTGAAGSGNTFVTYGTNGLRPLATIELEAGTINNSLGAAGTTGTNFTTAGENLTAGVAHSVNALRVTGGTLNTSGTVLTNTSGAILFTAAASITNGTLRLPTNVMVVAGAGGYTNRIMTEGIISLQGAAPFTAGIGSAIAGATNVVVSGNNAANTLVLAGANSFTNLIVNNTRVSFATETNLGGGTVTLAGGTLVNQAAAFIPTNHNIILGNSGGTLDVSAGTLTIGSVISGGQSLTKNGTGLLSLSAGNSFSGGLILNGGSVRGTTNAASLGNGIIFINGGNVELLNDTQISYNRPVVLNGSTTNVIGNLTALVSTNTFTMGNLTMGNQRLSVTNGGSSTSGTNFLTYGTVTLTNSGATFSVGSSAAAVNNQLNVGAIANQGYNTTFETDARGRVLITGSATGTGSLIFNGAGTNILSGDNSNLGGDVFVNDTAKLILTNNNALRVNNRVTLASGATLQINASPTLSEINGTGNITNNFSTNTVTLTLQRDLAQGATTIGGSIGDAAGAGGLATAVLSFTKSGTGLLTLTNNNPFSGALTVTGGNQIFTFNEGGELRLQGENARASTNTSVVIQQGGTLTLGSTVDTVKVDRLSDRGTVTMQNGNNFLNLNGANSAGITREIVSNFTINTGFQTITLNPTAGNEAELVYRTNFTRNGNSTLLVRGTGLGQVAGTANSSRFYGSAPAGATGTVLNNFNLLGGGGAAGSTTISISPFVIGDTSVTGFGGSFVTYVTNATGVGPTNGIRPLTDAEYNSGNLGTAAKVIAPLFAPDTFGLTNFNVAPGGQTVSGSLTPVVNAVRIGGGTVDIGTGRVLTVDSGAILMTNDTTITGGTLLFNREAVIHSMGPAALNNTINSVIAGTGGVTFSANNPGTSVTLGGNNIFVGTVNINGDPLIINNAGALNSFTPNSVTINGGRLALNGNNISINALTVNGPAGIIENNAAGNAALTVFSGTFNGLLSDGNGAGTLSLIKNGTGTLNLVANNTSFANSLSGDIILNSGILRYGSDHALGNGTLVINGGQINPAGANARTIPNPIRLGGNMVYGDQNSTTFQGPFDLGGAVRQVSVDGGQNATFNGPISNGGFVKTGANTLTLGGTNNFDGALVIRGGQINLNSPAALGSTNGATFILGGALDLNGQAGPFTESFFIASGSTANALRNTAGTNAILNGPITLLDDAVIATTNYTINGQIAGTGDLQINTGGTVTLTASNRLTGALSINGIANNPGAVTVSGLAGALVNTTNILINSGNTLNLGATADTGASAVNLNRLNDAARVTLNSGILALANGTNTTEVIGSLNFNSGRSVLTLNPSSGSQVTLTNTGTIDRGTGATALLRGTALGQPAAINTTRLTVAVANAPAQIGGGGAQGSQTISIVPWAVGDNNIAGLGTNFVTYSNVTGTGFRVLADSELATNLPLAGLAPVITTNYISSFGFTNIAANGNLTVNALKIGTNTAVNNPVIDLGTTTLTNVSGAFLVYLPSTSTNLTITNGVIQFGTAGVAREGIFHVVTTNTAFVITNAAQMLGTGGFTFSPNQTGTTLILSNNNNGLSGPITINGGTVTLTTAGSLGAAGNALTNYGNLNLNGISITNNGIGGNLTVAGGAATVVNPNVTPSTITLDNSVDANYAGTIGTNIALVKTGAGTQTLSGVNSFSNVVINNGTLVALSNLSTLGNGAVVLAGGNVTYGRTNSGNFSNIVNVLSNGTITLDSLATKTGTITTLGAVTVTNAASSTLTLAGASSTSGTLQLTIPTINLTNASTNFTLLVNNNGLGATTLANISSGVQLGTNTLTVDGTGNTTIAGNAAGITNQDPASTAPAQRFGLVKQGTGLLTLTGTNYFTNDIAILGGTLRGQSNGAFGLSTNRTAIVLGGGTLQLANAAATAFRQNVTVSNDSTIIADRAVLGAGVTHSLSNILFTNAAGNYTVTVLGTNANSGTMGVSFTTNLLASGNNAIFNVANSGQGADTLLTLGGVSGGLDTSITKSGNGILLINGNNLTAFTGSITNNAGILRVGNTGALGGGSIAGGASGTVIAGAATLDLNGINVTNEPITIGGAGVNGLGTLISGTGTGIAGNLTITNDTTFGGAGGMLLSNLSSAFTLTKVGAGTLQIGGATNTYSGVFNVLQGTLQANSASAFGTNTVNGGLNVSSGAAININGQSILSGDTINMISGSGPAGAGAFVNTSGTSGRFDGNIVQMGATTYGVSGAGNLTNNGVISGIGTVNKAGTGAGSWILTRSNTYRGDTLVSGGTMILGNTNGSALSSPLFTVQSNGVLSLVNTSAANNTNRIGDCIQIQLNAGTFNFVNDNSAANYFEKVGGLLVVLGANTVSSTPAPVANTSELRLWDLTRTAGSTLNFSGAGLGGSSNMIVFANSPTLDDGIIGGWATVNFADFATHVGGSVTNLSVYNTGAEGTWVAADNVKVTAGDNLGAARNVNSLTLQSGAAQTLNLGGQTLTVESGGILTGGNNVSITNGTLTAGVNGAGGYELVSIVSNGIGTAIGAVIADNGANPVSVVLAGQSLTATNIIAGNNTFTGGATINSGTVQLANAGALNTSGTNTLTINGGLLDLNNNSVTVSALNGNGLGTITNLTTVVAANQLPTTLTINSTASNRFDGVIAGTNVALVKDGPGTQTLAGNNTYTGQTVINAGVIEVLNNTALGATGSTTNNTTVTGSGAAIHLNSTTNGLTVAELASLAGTGIANGGALRNLAGTNTWSGGLVILTNGARINSDAGKLILSGAINNGAFNLTLGGEGETVASGTIGAGAGTVTKDGNGTVTLTGANTFTGGFIMESGTLLLGQNTSIGAAGGTVKINGGTISANTNANLTIANPIMLNGDVTLGQANGGTGALTFNNQVDLGTGIRTLTINNSSNIISGPILGTGGITKEGTGALYLGGINPFTGAVTINNGAIIMTTSGAFNSSSNLLTVGANGRLTMNGNDAYLGSLAGSAGGIVENTGIVNATLNLNQTANTTFSGLLQDGGTGTLSLIKSGTGTLTLGGSNSYSGLTIITDGTVKLSNGGALSTNAVVVTSGGTVDLNGQTLANRFDGITGVGVSSGGALVNNNAVPATQNGSLLQTGDTAYGGTGNLTINGTLFGTGGITKVGSGILTITGTNLLTGNIAVNAGTLRVGSANGLGGAALNPVITVTNGAAIDLNGVNLGTKNIAAISGTGVGGLGALVNNAAGTQGTNAGNIALTGDTTFGGTGNFGLSGVISGTNTALTKVGTNTITISGANTYSGTTYINEGILLLRSANGLGTTPAGTFIADGATLDLGGQTSAEPIWGVTGAGVGGRGAIVNNVNTGTFLGNVSLTGNTVIGATANFRMDGVISGSSGITKAGGSALTLTATNTYTGATVVNAGSLVLSNINGSIVGTASVTINSNATLTLDNISGTNANRINDAATITMNGGTLNFLVNAASTGVLETNGALTLGRGNNLIVSQPSAGNASALTFASLTRSGSATVNFTNSGTLGLGGTSNTIAFLTAPANDDGILGGWATVNFTDFARYTDGAITNLVFADYNSGAQGTWVKSDNVLVNADTTLTANRGVNSLNITNATRVVLNLGGLTLTNESGGIIASGGTGHVITNGFLTAGTNAAGLYELVTTVAPGVTLTNAATITNNGLNALTFVNAGAGTNVLRGTNRFTGGTVINSGTLRLDAQNALGTNNLTLHGGTLTLNGQNITISNLSGTAGTIENSVAAAAGGVLHIRDSGANIYSGVLADGTTGSLKVNKIGTGTLTLAGNNTFGGAITNGAGTLILGSPTALGGTGGGTVVSNGATLDLNGQFVAAGENINAAGITGAGVGGLGAMVNNSANPARWQGNFAMGGNTTVGGTGELGLAGNVSGAFRLTKIGANTLILGGTNTFTGGLSISNGVVRVDRAGALNLTGVNVVTNEGGTLRLNGNSVVIAGLSGANGSATVDNAAIGTNATLTISNSLNFNFAGVIADGAAGTLLNIVKTNTGSQTLSGANTYTGTTLINQGTLIAGNASALGSTDGGTIIASGATLDLGGQNIGAESITSISGTGVGGTGALVNNSSTDAVFGGTVAMTGNTSIGGSGYASLNGVISGAFDLTQAGTGTNALSGANTYSGNTFINSGALNIQNASALGTTNNGTTINAGALEIQGGITTSEALTLNGSGIANGGALRNISGNNVVNGQLTLGSSARINSDNGTLGITGNAVAHTGTGSRTLTLGGASAGFLDVSLGDKSSTETTSIVKDGSGTWTLSKPNSFTGSATINNGTLAANGPGVLGGTSQITVNTGGTLMLAGTGDRIKDSTPMTLAGGTFQTMGQSETLGVLTLSASSTIDLGAGASILRFDDSSAASWTGGAILNIWNWTGSFDGWSSPGGGTDQIYFGNGSNSMTLAQGQQIRFYSDAGITPVGTYGQILCNGEVVPVPEPATWIAAAAMLALLGYRERKRLVAVVQSLRQRA